MIEDPAGLAIGRLCDNSGTVSLGTAFAVSQALVLTAFHCIGDYESGSVLHEEVLLEFPIARRVNAKYVTGNHQNDYAILLLQEPLPSGLAPVPLLSKAIPHESFRSAGYPSLLQGPDITSIGGQVRTDESSIFGGVHAIQLFSNEGAAGLSLQGMSGAPVLVRNLEAAIGLIRWNPPRTTAPELGIGGIVFCCPVRPIIDQHPDLSNLIVEIKYDDKIADLLLILEDLRSNMREELSQALTLLHREKLAKAEVLALQPEWTSIPYWQFALPIGSEPEEVRNEFFKTIIRTVACSLEELFPRTITEVQILVLLRLTIDGNVWQLTLACPQQEVVAYLLDHTPPRVSVEKWIEGINKLTSDLRHKYGVVAQVGVPDV
jgi:hypothetical protein